MFKYNSMASIMIPEKDLIEAFIEFNWIARKMGKQARKSAKRIGKGKIPFKVNPIKVV